VLGRLRPIFDRLGFEIENTNRYGAQSTAVLNAVLAVEVVFDTQFTPRRTMARSFAKN
jgi:hypothetical protein